MEIYLKRQLAGLVPEYSSDVEKFSKLKVGEVYRCDLKRSRNIKFHKKYFALLNLVYSNQETWTDFEGFRAYVIIKSGYSKKYITEKGLLVLPSSISFSEMDEDTFSEMYDKTLTFLIKEFLPESTKKDIEDNLINFY